MKTLVLISAVTALGFIGCSHPQQATRPAANELPYHQPGKRGPRPAPVDQASTQRECVPATSTGNDATGGSGPLERAQSESPLPTCPENQP